MSKDSDYATQRGTNIRFEILSNMMRVMNGPVAWHKHMYGNKTPRRSLPRPERMEINTFVAIWNHDLLDRNQFGLG